MHLLYHRIAKNLPANRIFYNSLYVSEMLMEKIVGIGAGITIGIAQITYIIHTIQRKVRPSVLSWLGWAILMGTSLLSQMLTKGWQWSMTGILCSTIGCVIISLVALLVGHYAFRRRHWLFLLAGLACLGVYQWSDNPWVTTVFAIIADALLGILTITSAIRNPSSEKSFSWIYGTVSATLAVLICFGHPILFALFPVYLLVFNLGMVVLTHRAYNPENDLR
jgi:hypothetical protein